MNVISCLAILGVLLFCTCGEATVYLSTQASLTSAKLRTEHDGFSGSGYVEFTSIGSLATWGIYTPATGEYKLSIAYSSIYDAALQAASDGLLLSTFRCLSTNAWSEWKTETTTINLTRGYHALSLESLEQVGPHVDSLSLVFTEATDHENEQLDKPQRSKQALDMNKQKKITRVLTPSPIPFSIASPTIAPIPHKTLWPTYLSTSPPTSDAPMPAKSPSPTSTPTFQPTLAHTPAPNNTPTSKPSRDYPTKNGKSIAVLRARHLSRGGGLRSPSVLRRAFT